MSATPMLGGSVQVECLVCPWTRPAVRFWSWTDYDDGVPAVRQAARSHADTEFHEVGIDILAQFRGFDEHHRLVAHPFSETLETVGLDTAFDESGGDR